jgi:hypothetical protein
MIKKILSFLICMILASCRYAQEKLSEEFQNTKTNQLDTLTSEESKKITQMSNGIINCFEKKDKEALKNLFCEQIRNMPDFNEEIEKAFEYLKCDVYISSTLEDHSSGGESKEFGKRVSWYLIPEIPYFKILTGPSGNMKDYYYSISYYWQIIHEEDKSLEGLHSMKIELLNVSEIIIGKRLIH